MFINECLKRNDPLSFQINNTDEKPDYKQN